MNWRGNRGKIAPGSGSYRASLPVTALVSLSTKVSQFIIFNAKTYHFKHKIIMFDARIINLT